MGNLNAEEPAASTPPYLPGLRLILLPGLGMLILMAIAVAAALLQLRMERELRQQHETVLTMTRLSLDALSLAERLRTVHELGTQAGSREARVADELHKMLQDLDADQSQWRRHVAAAAIQGSAQPQEALAAGGGGRVDGLASALQSLRAAVEASVLAGATAAAAPPKPLGSSGVAADPAAAYLAVVEASRAELGAAVRAGTEDARFQNYLTPRGALAAAVTAGASALALALALLVVILIKRARRESRATIDVMGRLLRTDPLTGITNRRGLDENLPVEISRAKRSGKTLTVAMLDLDFFKRYNSRRGHAGGDSLLRSAAQAWRKQLRPTDTLVRYGGEEFTLVLPSCDAEQACELIERLRPLLPDRQTFSAGTATWDTSESADALLRRADQALAHAKRQGRNRTVVAGCEDQIALALPGS